MVTFKKQAFRGSKLEASEIRMKEILDAEGA